MDSHAQHPNVTRRTPQRIVVIINPAAGQEQPILKVLNATLQAAGVDWDVQITKEAGDAARLAQEAAAAGANVVAIHGGDGSVMEAAAGVAAAGNPQAVLAILPGGTANVMAQDLLIPTDLAAACALLVDPQAETRCIDMGWVGDHPFLLRVGMGLEAAMVEGADRELKDRLGVFAYAISALQAMADPPVAHYRLTLDSAEVVEIDGLTCIVANSGAWGMGDARFHPDISVSDGKLDVIVVTRSDVASLAVLAVSVLSKGETPPSLQRWPVQTVRVEAEPPQTVQLDGEIIGHTPIEVRVQAQAVPVLVPAARPAAG
jgi:YegS/Rv2252/BmrU family lipid kinase